jgi:C_GCAxxG_C_C family probable redox protein
MGRTERAVELFAQGHACSQAVLVPWSGELGLDESTAARIAAPFAAGIQLGSLCGALTGAIMVIGLSKCSDSCTTRGGRAVTIEPALELATRFEGLLGSLSCPGVIGCDLREPGVRQRALDEGLFATRCAPAVRVASEILEDLLGPS